MEGRKKASITYIVLSLATTLLLIFSSDSAIAQSSPQAAQSWNGPGGNYPYNYGYSPQTAIGPSDAQNLGVSWVYPEPINPFGGKAQSITLTPLIIGGVVYFISDGDVLTALNLATGAVIWSQSFHLTYPNGTLTKKGTPGFLNPSIIINRTNTHYHALWYTSTVRGAPLLWVMLGNYSIMAWNAQTGTLNLKFNPISLYNPIAGNFGKYKAIGTNQITIDEKRGILVMSSAGDEGDDAGRGFFDGYNILTTPPTFLWRSFTIPPQDGSNPNWSVQSVNNMTHAWIFDGTNAVDLKAMSASQLQSVMGNDWGDFGYTGGKSYAGANGAWGGSEAVDPQTGIFYLATAQPSPDWNATNRPGPNAWSDSVIAVDGTTGKFIWAFQTTSHDTWDYDCSWSVVLANATINNQNTKAIFKGCKNGYLYALDAATGKMLWVFNAPSIKRTPFTKLHNPLDPAQLKLPWANFPSKDFFLQNPTGTGAIESNPAYDPSANLVFVATYNAPSATQATNVWTNAPYGVSGSKSATPEAGGFLKQTPNATIWAIDANTGAAKWSYFIPNVGFRGGVTVSNGVLYVPAQDGSIYMLNSNTGKLITSKYVGAAMITQPAIGTDANGKVQIVEPGSTGSNTGALIIGSGLAGPGLLFALSAQTLPVVTTTALSTVTSSVTTSTTTGISDTAFYGAVAVAAIFVIATGVLAARRRTPAS